MEIGESYKKLSVNSKIPHTTVTSVVGKYKRLENVENLERNDRPRKITQRSERKMLRMIKNPQITLKVISRLASIRDKCYTQDHKYKLLRNQLQSRSPRKTPLLERHRQMHGSSF